MDDSTLRSEAVPLDVKNIGGISDTTVEFDPGVTLLTGRNATNRTSLLQSIMAALGGTNATIKGDADFGEVELRIGDSTYTRRLKDENGTTVLSGEPYLEDETVADLFAFLLESNRARQAVIRGSDLREIIMEPIDTQEIEEQIEQARSR